MTTLFNQTKLTTSHATPFLRKEQKTDTDERVIPTAEELHKAIKQKNSIIAVTPGIFDEEALVITFDHQADAKDINETRELLRNTILSGITDVEFAPSKPCNTLSIMNKDYDKFMENFETLRAEERTSMEAMR